MNLNKSFKWIILCSFFACQSPDSSEKEENKSEIPIEKIETDVKFTVVSMEFYYDAWLYDDKSTQHRIFTDEFQGLTVRVRIKNTSDTVLDFAIPKWVNVNNKLAGISLTLPEEHEKSLYRYAHVSKYQLSLEKDSTAERSLAISYSLVNCLAEMKEQFKFIPENKYEIYCNNIIQEQDTILCSVEIADDFKVRYFLNNKEVSENDSISLIKGCREEDLNLTPKPVHIEVLDENSEK